MLLFQQYITMDISLPTSQVHDLAILVTRHLNLVLRLAKSAIMFDDKMQSVKFAFGNYIHMVMCSTLINFLSFAQLSLIREKMSALTLSLPFSKTECALDHHSFIKSALFFQSFGFFQISSDFMSFKCWNLSLSFEAQNCY